MLQITTNARSEKLWPGAWAALLGFVAAASAVFWVLNFPAGNAVLVVPVVQSAGQTTAPSALQPSRHMVRALGVQAPLPEVSIAQSSRFQLKGVVAGTSGQGSALIAVDGQPPKAFRVGDHVKQGVQLFSLNPKQARLKTKDQEWVLDLPSTNAP
ncbi:MAG: hypothetical protein RJB14_1864 [Pseudomonadota bacterium]